MRETNTLQPGTTVKRIRLTVTRWDEEYIYGKSEEYPGAILRARYRGIEAFDSLPSLLWQEAEMNLLTVSVEEGGVLQPELFVLAPDYLIDISALAECMQTYGHSPLNYLVQKLRPRENSHYILLGNAANQFLDDCVNEQPGQPATYDRSMQKVFRNEMLAYSANGHIDSNYFNSTRQQFSHIRETVQAVFSRPDSGIEKNGALLEPSFLCECMGLQGRMDFLQGDCRTLIELKSGKADEQGRNLFPRENHAMQMALYKEVLHYCLDLPRSATASYLFYSKYPRLFAGHSTLAQIQQVMQLRNAIVAQERGMRQDGGRALLSTLTADKLHVRGANSPLWNGYQRPQLEQMLSPLRTTDTLLADYFYTFTAFVTREQFLSKTGDGHFAADSGFANTWNADTATKQAAGNILLGLKITDFVFDEGIEKVVLRIPEGESCFLPNFRQGDIVLLYERNREADNATNRQVIRGSIERIETRQVVIALRNKQRNPLVFHRESLYAIEHDFMDSSYSALYKGLYSLLTALPLRRDLLLCRRTPERDTTRTLLTTPPNAQIRDIVLQAKQARDYYLLVGPPGTGKTSVALRAMVEEFHATPGANILLLAYTNRAVDEVCDMLESISPAPSYLRIGSELACEARFRPHLTKEFMRHCQRRSEVCQALQEVRLIVGTVAAINSHPELFTLKHFDVAVVDEASQILEPQIMGLLCAHKDGVCAIDKFILIGDHKQLPAVVLQHPDESAVNLPSLHAIGLTDCRNSLFQRLIEQQARHPQEGIQAMLHRQGRMHPGVCGFVNSHFYSGRLDTIPVPHQQEPLEWLVYDGDDTQEALVARERVAFIDAPLPHKGDAEKSNRHEASLCARIVKAVYTLCQKNNLPFNAARRIGIIVPFRNQIMLTRHALEQLQIEGTGEISIDTVERYQGSQRDVIIYCTTVSRPAELAILSAPVVTDGVLIDRKLNVALTRARKQLFVIGHRPLLCQSELYREFIEEIEGKKTVC